MPRRTRTGLSTALFASCTAALFAPATNALAQDFYDGEILMYATNYPDGAGGTLRGIVRFDPVNMSYSLLYGTPSGVYTPHFTYDPYRDAVIHNLGNSPTVYEIDSNGNQTSFTISGANNIDALAAGGPQQQIYVYYSRKLWYIDTSNTLQPLLDTNGVDQYSAPDGIDASSPAGFIGPTAMYYDLQSNSIYYSQGRSFGAGSNESFIRKVELDPSGNQVTAVTSVQLNPSLRTSGSPTVIGPGPDSVIGNRLSFLMNVPDLGLHARAMTLETNTMTPEPYAEMSFEIFNDGSIPGCPGAIYSSGALKYGIYSPLTDSFMVFHSAACQATIGMWEYSEGDVDLSATPDDIMPMDYYITHMLVVETRCGADVNGDGVIDNGDIIAFISFFLADDIAVDFSGDGVLDNADIGAFISAFLAGC